jgi:hypothetical protein
MDFLLNNNNELFIYIFKLLNFNNKMSIKILEIFILNINYFK